MRVVLVQPLTAVNRPAAVVTAHEGADEPVGLHELGAEELAREGRVLRRELLDDGWVDLDTVIRGIEAVTIEDLLRVGERVVRLDHAVLAAVGPLDDVDGLRAAIGA